MQELWICQEVPLTSMTVQEVHPSTFTYFQVFIFFLLVYPSLSKVNGEVANLSERKNTNPPVFCVKNLSVYW